MHSVPSADYQIVKRIWLLEGQRQSCKYHTNVSKTKNLYDIKRTEHDLLYYAVRRPVSVGRKQSKQLILFIFILVVLLISVRTHAFTLQHNMKKICIVNSFAFKTFGILKTVRVLALFFHKKLFQSFSTIMVSKLYRNSFLISFIGQYKLSIFTIFM